MSKPLKNQKQIEQAVNSLKHGGVIAYPTEGVFGLGCDPFNETAVHKILKLKHRDVTKGLILIASSWDQVQDLTKPIPDEKLQNALNTWPGPYTWIFPASVKTPKWITGKFDSIAIRVTAHPIAKTICEQYGGAIVSTSANIEGEPPATTAIGVKQYFSTGIDIIIDEAVGNLNQPTTIQDVMSGKTLR